MNSSKSSGHLVIWKRPPYFSAIDSAGSIIMVAFVALMLTYVPALILAAFLMFLGIITLPFSSIFAVVSLIEFPTINYNPTNLSLPTIDIWAGTQVFHDNS